MGTQEIHGKCIFTKLNDNEILAAYSDRQEFQLAEAIFLWANYSPPWYEGDWMPVPLVQDKNIAGYQPKDEYPPRLCNFPSEVQNTYGAIFRAAFSNFEWTHTISKANLLHLVPQNGVTPAFLRGEQSAPKNKQSLARQENVVARERKSSIPDCIAGVETQIKAKTKSLINTPTKTTAPEIFSHREMQEIISSSRAQLNPMLEIQGLTRDATKRLSDRKIIKWINAELKSCNYMPKAGRPPKKVKKK